MARSTGFYLFTILFLLGNFRLSPAQICDGTKVILLDTALNDGTDWVLEFEDNFSDSSLDLTKWKLKESHQGNLDGSGAYCTLDNVTVSPESYEGASTSASGVCQVFLKKESVTRPAVFWDPASPVFTYHYTNADIVSRPKFKWGKYEIRCKLPKGTHFTSAFWTYGQVNGRGDEIDVFEFMEEKNALGKYDSDKRCKYVQQHYHTWNKSDPGNSVDHNCGATYKTNTDYSLDFHTFSLVWDRWGMSWYIDDKLVKLVPQWCDLSGGAVTKENIKPSQVVIRNDWFPRNEMEIIFGLGIQTQNGSDEPSDFPGVMVIDYIRYYKQQ